MIGRRIILLNLFILVTFSSPGQIRKCAVDSRMTPASIQRLHDLQIGIDSYAKKGSPTSRIVAQVINIPVVVHIIHSNRSGQIGGPDNGNISDEQVFSQIKVLNNDFRRLVNTPGFNQNPVGADMEINFYLATKDENGLPSSGIRRVFNSKKTFDVFGDNLLLSSLSYWDSNRYLNVWVTTLTDNYIGFAEFPTADNVEGLDVAETDERTDGVIIDHTVFGNQSGTATGGVYTYGRTVTHEIGHWLGLIHIWGDSFCGSDYVADTPTAEGSNSSLECKPVFSNCNGIRTQNMIENYLDYTPDSCMNIFTQGQKARVRTVFEVSRRRNRLFNTSVLNFEKVDFPSLSILGNPGSGQDLKIQVLLPGFQDFQLKVYNLTGQEIYTKNYRDFPGIIVPASKLVNEAGIYFVQLTTNGQTLTKRIAVF